MHRCIWILYIFLSVTSFAQSETWTLKQCIEHSWKNSLQVKQADLSLLQSQLSRKQAWWAQFPSANASVRHSANFGRSIDLTSYDYVNQTVQITSFSVGINAPIYQGWQIRNRIKSAKIDVQAAEQDIQQVRNDLALSVAQAYLSVLLAEENLQVLQAQNKVTQSQLERTTKLIQAGTLPENARYELEAQMAVDEENIVRAGNTVTLAYLNLKTLLNLDAGKDISIERVQITLPESVQWATLDEIYSDALTRMPNITASRMREHSAQIGVKVAKGALQPSISAFGNLSTNYSSTAKEVTSFDTLYQTVGGEISGVPFTIDFPMQSPNYRNKPFFNQFADNISFAMGLNLQIPIFNGLQARIAIERAELAVESAKLNSERLEVQLKADIQRALIDAQAAEKRLQAAEKTLVATRAAVENTRKRFDLGVVNGFELTSVQTRLVNAESSVLQARYDYLFKLKILDFYRGIEITIE